MQVATVLANMAARTDTRQKLLSQDLVQVLLYLLAASPETQGDLAAMAATQRVQQKAAIGISRLAGEALIVEGILSGSGLDRLVELSVCKKARLDSDSTLVAVITAVRRLAEQEDVLPLLEHLPSVIDHVLDGDILAVQDSPGVLPDHVENHGRQQQ